MSEPTWTLRIPGAFVLERDGEVVERSGGRKEELLLAIDPTTPKACDRVAGDLWRDVDWPLGLESISYTTGRRAGRLSIDSVCRGWSAVHQAQESHYPRPPRSNTLTHHPAPPRAAHLF
jgi:hypothetical protein